MPYIIEHKRRVSLGWRPTGQVESAKVTETLSRVAVATLEEARGKVWDLGAYATPDLAAQTYFDKDGGTVGPLPDGTTIEVKRATWDHLIRDAGGGFPEIPEKGEDEEGPLILAAYNAALGGTECLTKTK